VGALAAPAGTTRQGDDMSVIERWTLMGAPLGRVHVTGGPPLSSPEQPDGIGVEIEVVPASQLKGAVSLSDNEWNRVLWLLHRPTPPGPLKALDEAIIGKINHTRGQ
jgi:hypothetical protein